MKLNKMIIQDMRKMVDIIMHNHAILNYKLENLDQCVVSLHVSLKNINFAQSWFPWLKYKVNKQG
jgi:hypothetical protein